MILKTIMEKVKSVWSSGLHQWPPEPSYFTPNNRILWNIPSFTTSNTKPDYKVQTTTWNVENKGWKTDDTNDMFYDIKK